MSVAAALLREPHTDEAWPLYLAQRILEGQRQGVGFFEVNPPLYIWASIPAAILGELTGISEWRLWVLMVAVTAAISLGITARLLRAVEPDAGRRRLFLSAAAIVFLVLPRMFFSEREHLSLILVLPFLVASAGRAQRVAGSKSGIFLAGVMGGAGFSIKPHFLVAWLAVELWLLARLGTKSMKRGELWTLIAFGAAYLTSVVLFAPDYFPMVQRLAPLYHTYLNNGVIGAIRLAGPGLLLVVGMVIAVRYSSPSVDPIAEALTVAFFGFLTAAILQQKGLTYHYLPAWGTGLLVIVRSWQTRPIRLSWYPTGILARLGFLAVPLVFAEKTLATVRELIQPSHPRYRPVAELPELIRVTRELAAGQPIIVLSTNPVGGWPLTLSAGARWASRYMHFWPLAAIYDEQLWRFPPRMVQPIAPAERSEAEQRFIDEFVQDLQRHQPRLVIVLLPDSARWGMGGARRFDYLQYFGMDSRFRDFITRYHPYTQIGDYQIFSRMAP